MHLAVYPLYLLSWRLVLIEDFVSNTPTSWRVFFSWLDVVKGFFFTIGRILRSSTTVVLCGCPGIFMLRSSPVCSFFSQNVPVDLATLPFFMLSLLFIYFYLKPNNCLFHLHVEILWLHDVGSKQQLPNANGTLRIISRTFTCLIDVDKMKE